VEEEFVRVREVGQGSDFVWLVDRAHFGGLRDGDDARLDVVLIADAVVVVRNGVDGELAVRGRDGNEFAAGEFFRRAALVGVDVRASAQRTAWNDRVADCRLRTLAAVPLKTKKTSTSPKCSRNLARARSV